MQSQKPYIVIPEATPEDAHYLIHALEDDFRVQCFPETLEMLSLALLRDAYIVAPFVHSHLGDKELAMMPYVKLIATRSTGYDHIDLQAAREHGVMVANVPHYGETAVAEYTFALLLLLSRKLYQSHPVSAWGQATAMTEMQGINLNGKKLGVVGTGAIGRQVIRIARGFNMRVFAYDVMPNPHYAAELGFKYVDLLELLTQADIVTLHIPALESTYHLLNHEKFALMKPGAILINTARGSLVDTEALLWALKTRRLSAAALDTVEGEELLAQEAGQQNVSGREKLVQLLQQLQNHPDVVITPHIAFNSKEALRCILDTTIANIRAFQAEHPQNIVQ